MDIFTVLQQDWPCPESDLVAHDLGATVGSKSSPPGFQLLPADLLSVEMLSCAKAEQRTWRCRRCGFQQLNKFGLILLNKLGTLENVAGELTTRATSSSGQVGMHDESLIPW